jgi:hypothetical protein
MTPQLFSSYQPLLTARLRRRLRPKAPFRPSPLNIPPALRSRHFAKGFQTAAFERRPIGVVGFEKQGVIARDEPEHQAIEEQSVAAEHRLGAHVAERHSDLDEFRDEFAFGAM